MAVLRDGLVLLGAMVMTAGTPAFAQVDFSGEWRMLVHEDGPHRGGGPEIGDYTGLPVNDAARLAADAWDASILTLPELQGFIQRNGLAVNDKTIMTEYLIRHDDYLTSNLYVDDPVYLEEPLLRNTTWVLDTGLVDLQKRYPCGPNEIVVEVPRSKGEVPHHLPGTNPMLRDFAVHHGLPFEATRGGARRVRSGRWQHPDRHRASCQSGLGLEHGVAGYDPAAGPRVRRVRSARGAALPAVARRRASGVRRATVRGGTSYVTGSHNLKVGFADSFGYLQQRIYSHEVPYQYRSSTACRPGSRSGPPRTRRRAISIATWGFTPRTSGRSTA